MKNYVYAGKYLERALFGHEISLHSYHLVHRNSRPAIYAVQSVKYWDSIQLKMIGKTLCSSDPKLGLSSGKKSQYQPQISICGSKKRFKRHNFQLFGYENDESFSQAKFFLEH